MRRRRRFGGYRRPRVGPTLVTLTIMSVLLGGIFLVGDEFAKKLSLLFSAPTADVESGVETLPAKLGPTPGPAGVTDPAALPMTAGHTGAWVRRATREATIVARRAIARSSSAGTLNPADVEERSP